MAEQRKSLAQHFVGQVFLTTFFGCVMTHPTWIIATETTFRLTDWNTLDHEIVGSNPTGTTVCRDEIG